jgi:folate-binding protein YgfZ
MNNAWLSYLAEQGARFDDQTNTLLTFGIPEIEHHSVKFGPVMSPLLNEGLIRIGGDDAKTFLQSQLSQDVNLVTPEQAKLAAYCDPQGQVLGLGILFMYFDAYYWLVPKDTVLPLLSRLKMFVMRSKVELEDFSDLLPRFGYAGEHAAQDLLILGNVNLTGNYRQTLFTREDLSSVAVICIPSANPCYLFIGPPNEIIAAWDTMETSGMGVGSDDWALIDTVYGMPRVSANLQGKFTAHLLNLDRIDAINFKKGCYPGQEIIARMQYRGKPTKRMVRLHTDVEQDFSVGEDIILSYHADRQLPITVIRTGKDLTQGTILLAVASLKGLEDAEGVFVLPNGAEIVMEVLGYTLTDLSSNT